MSGGISAIRGFDYQATVILDLMLDHFDQHGTGASVRPEGEDDLDLRWDVSGVEHRRFIQVKKPTEDVQAQAKPSPWTLPNIVERLLPDALGRLVGNSFEQVWVLGDDIEDRVAKLFDAGALAPVKEAQAYWSVVHRLACTHGQTLLAAKSSTSSAVSRWRAPNTLPSDPLLAGAELVFAANSFVQRHGTEGQDFARHYKHEVRRLHGVLPGILSRIRVCAANGSEIDVADRVMQRLEQRYQLLRQVIEFTLFRNLRGFINDISKQPGRTFDQEELETELRSVWPLMVPIKSPPPLEADHVRRPFLADKLSEEWEASAIEVVGISGSGKTRLAAEVIERHSVLHPNQLALYAEVRHDNSLRDCVAGAAFHLRRRGIAGPFAVAIQPEQSAETALINLAKSFAIIPTKCLLVLDFVEGREPDGFARDLATFIRGMARNTLRVVVFGQQRSLRELTGLEQAQFGVRGIDAPGLTFEQFVTMVAHRHNDPNRVQLSALYEQITAGREAGLYVSLAQALARAQTFDEMAAIAALPAEERLGSAERSRFSRISTAGRAAAEKLTCFAMPFRRVEAEDKWHDMIGEPTIADAILDRIVHNAHRITLEGDSMRKRKNRPLTDAEISDTNPT